MNEKLPKPQHVFPDKTRGLTPWKPGVPRRTPTPEAKAPYRVYTVTDLVRVLQLSRKTVLDMLRDGRIKGTKFGAVWRISQPALDEYFGLPPNPTI